MRPTGEVAELSEALGSGGATWQSTIMKWAMRGGEQEATGSPLLLLLVLGQSNGRIGVREVSLQVDALAVAIEGDFGDGCNGRFRRDIMAGS